jgi:hypothetical protein
MPIVKPSKKLGVRPKARIEDDTELDDETEAKAEPKVVVNKQLSRLMSEWKNAEDKADSYFPRIVQFVIENDTERKELKQALLDRGMKDLSAVNEVSVIMRVSEFPDEVQACIDGEFEGGVRALRELGKKKQEGSDDPETKFKKSIERVATFAIDQVDLDQADFVAEAKSAYKKAYAKLEAKEARNAAKAKDGADEDEDSTEDEE